MLDLGLTKLAVIGAVALVVIGPERLPRVARTVGTLWGRAQRYISDVKTEVNRQIALEELNQVRSDVDAAAAELTAAWRGEPKPSFDPAAHWVAPAAPVSRNGRASWGVKRGKLPQWFKRAQHVRQQLQSGAARVKRHRPAGSPPRPFF